MWPRITAGIAVSPTVKNSATPQTSAATASELVPLTTGAGATNRAIPPPGSWPVTWARSPWVRAV